MIKRKPKKDKDENEKGMKFEKEKARGQE